MVSHLGDDLGRAIRALALPKTSRPQLQRRQSTAADTGLDEVRIQEPVLGNVQSMERDWRMRQTSAE